MMRPHLLKHTIIALKKNYLADVEEDYNPEISISILRIKIENTKNKVIVLEEENFREENEIISGIFSLFKNSDQLYPNSIIIQGINTKTGEIEILMIKNQKCAEK